MKVKDLISELINIGEKGANVARIIRSEQTLLELLVQEKTGPQKNERFVQDFKTLADVLVQQIVQHNLSIKFPGVKDSIFGEESNKFTNALGETITVQILSTPSDTASLLCKVLDGNDKAASLLARVVHEDVLIQPNGDVNQLDSIELPEKDIGVWIDPIDSTAQYIGGETGLPSNYGFVPTGLQCACVLIGVYNKQTGLPVAGVINQPFSTQDPDTAKWKSSCIWGVSVEGCSVSSVQDIPNHISNGDKVLLTSNSDKAEIKDKFSQAYSIHHAAGAGYKLLCVIQGLADAYVLSKNSTFKWDTCAPHAVLLALGGGIMSYKNLCDFPQEGTQSFDKAVGLQILYERGDNSKSIGVNQWCNSDGIVAYKSQDSLKRLLSAVRTT